MSFSFHALGGGAWLRFRAEWLGSSDADRYLSEVLQNTPWQQGSLRFFGKTVLEPRLSAWFGDLDYTYSGRSLRASAWPPYLQELRYQVQAAVEHPLNSVLANLYRDGQDSMGFHADDEPELGPNPLIASVSLGATRAFLLRPKKKSQHSSNERVASHAYALSHGSLLIMGGTCQHSFRHAVPKDPRVREPRINLTFRLICPANGTVL